MRTEPAKPHEIICDDCGRTHFTGLVALLTGARRYTLCRFCLPRWTQG